MQRRTNKGQDMRHTEILTQLEIQLSIEWAQAMREKRQDEHRRLKARAIETFNRLKKQRALLSV